MKNRNDIYHRWATASHDGYKEGWERTDYLLGLLTSSPVNAVRGYRILEIGCNVGRNMEGLRRLGFYDLHGVEINPNTETIRKQIFPELANQGKFKYMPIEEYIKTAPKPFDVIYTMAVLEHIHPDSEWVFDDLHTLVKPGGYLITIEDEKNHYGLDFVFPHSHEVLHGLKLLSIEDCRHIPGLEASNTARVFGRPADA